MRIPRFYHHEPLHLDTEIALTSDALHHCVNVLRLKSGAPIALFNGTGKEYACELIKVEKRKAIVSVQTELHVDPQSPLNIHLAQAISKGDRMEWVLQKATELGVTEITPLLTERCNVKLDAERWQKKQNQWQKIIIGACEQSGRNTLPKLNEPLTLGAFSTFSTTQLRLILSPKSELSLDRVELSQQHGCRLVIGPEGGLSEGEIHLLEESGYQPVRFGPRVLRTETAAISAIAIIQHRVGDLY